MMSADWVQQRAGAMTALSEAKQKGIIRAHGVSCHDFGALEAAAASDWVDVDLARQPRRRRDGCRRALGDRGAPRDEAEGQGRDRDEILGAGSLRKQADEALQFALAQDVLDCFTIGCENPGEFQDLLARIRRPAPGLGGDRSALNAPYRRAG